MQAASGIRPASTDELAEVLRRDSRPLAVTGSGSKRAIGRLVDAELLDLSALDGVVDYRPAELVLTARAGTRLAAIDALLAQHGQRLAFEPPDLGPLLGSPASAKKYNGAVTGTDGSTIGGVLAANLSGSRRVTAGAARDHFLGVTAVNGRGDVFRAGGKVVKNVTGYDLPKLLAGSWGTLAVMSEVTLKVVPAAETERTMIFPDRDPAAAVLTLTAALGSAHEVSSAGFDPWRGSFVRLEGLLPSVAARAEVLLRELGAREVETLEGRASRELWARHAGAEALADWRVVWRISVPPADAPRVLGAIQPARYLLDWGGGLIFAAYDTVDAARVRGVIRDGHALLLKAPTDSKPCRLHPPGAALGQALERVRDAFDPDRRLNPGRMD
jgi:glycolate oxidase FAD binding subunit